MGFDLCSKNINVFRWFSDTKHSIADGYLAIKNPVKYDTNNYTCFVENKFGMDQKLYTVEVTCKFQK